MLGNAHLGIIGYGSIAVLMLDCLKRAFQTPLPAVTCLVRRGQIERARARLGQFEGSVARNILYVDDIKDLVRAGPHMVVECAGQQAVRDYGQTVLVSGTMLIAVSIGALADEVLFENLQTAALNNETQLILPAGAIGGIDALRAAKLSGLENVTYVGRKPPSAWINTPAEKFVNLTTIDEPVEFFNGSALIAAREFPKNANVAATVAIAGVGFRNTLVRLIADPTVKGNIHELLWNSAANKGKLTIEGIASHDNPKTSVATAYSIAREILNRMQPVTI